MTRCTYEFHLEEWDAPVKERTKRLPDEWACPHEALDGSEYCPFHAEDAASTAIREAFSSALADDDIRTNSFIGATLPDLGLSGKYVTAGSPIDLRAVTFTETLNFEDSQFADRVRFEGARFNGRLELDDTRFAEEVSFYGCGFRGVVEGKGTTFERSAYFIGADFSYSLLLRSNTTFEDDLFFTGATFQSAADFRNATIEGQVFFRDVEFRGRTCFDRADIEDDARFAGAVFSGTLSFEHVHIQGVCQFGNEGVNREYDAASFSCPLIFEHAHCDGNVYFVGCMFDEDIELVKSDFKGSVDLGDTVFGGDVSLSRSNFHNLTVTPRSVEGQGLIRSIETTIDAGIIGQPTDGEQFSHFEQATIGSVEFVGEPVGDETSPRQDLSRTRFIDTRFTDFEFTSYRPGLEDDWELHRFDVENSFDSQPLSATERERTYMRAKSGADHVGDNRLAGMFFVKEMRARGKRHKEHLVTDRSIRDGYRYLGNLSFRMMSNYAESPQRVLGASIVTIGLFAACFTIGFQLSGLNHPYPTSPWLGYILLSGESFVTLVHNPAASIPSVLLRTIAILEGFIGTFTIALFLFSLTRAVHR